MANDVDAAESGPDGAAVPAQADLSEPISAPAPPAKNRWFHLAPVQRRKRTGLGGRLILLVLALVGVVGYYLVPGSSASLPLWAVVQFEDLVNERVSKAMPGTSASIGSIELIIQKNWVPQFRLQQVKLIKSSGGALVTLPSLQLTLQPTALVRGNLQVNSALISGLKLDIVRDQNGLFDISLGDGNFAREVKTLSQVFDALDAGFETPLFKSLKQLEVTDLNLTINDAKQGRTWQLTDGGIKLTNFEKTFATEITLKVMGADPAVQGGTIKLSFGAEKGQRLVRLGAEIAGISARDLSGQIENLDFDGFINAAISGNFSAQIEEVGVTQLSGDLGFGAGVLQPNDTARPIAFDRAQMALRYDAAQGRIELSELVIESPSLRATATGYSDLYRANGVRIVGPLTGEIPAAFVSQLQFSQVMIDPEGQFQEPVRFSTGALDTRLRLSPLQLDIGQLSLVEDNRRLLASGSIAASARGWQVALDVALNEIANDRLLALWPVGLVTGTRNWIAKNVLAGNLQNVRAGLRIAPGKEPKLHLGYDFTNAGVRFIATLPPIEKGDGYASIEGKSYTLVLTGGTVVAPVGGRIDVAGSVFKINDVTQKPAVANIHLITNSSLTASLSLLDLPPFNFMKKADRSVDLGDGTALIDTQLTLPLQKKIQLKDVDYRVNGVIHDFVSQSLVPKRKIAAKNLMISATPAGLEIKGAGLIGVVPFDVSFQQSFDPAQKGKARIEGDVTLSPKTVDEFGLGLPKDMVSGQGQGKVNIALTKGAGAKLTLTSDLVGIGLKIPQIGWSKPAGAKGRLETSVTLGKTPKVERLRLEAPDLQALGALRMRPGGGLDVASFETVKIADWFTGSVDFVGKGAGKPVEIKVTGGKLDLRAFPDPSERQSGVSQGGGPLFLSLDSLQVSAGIALEKFRGEFSQTGGLNGTFLALVNGLAPIKGTVVPGQFGTAVRIVGQDAGQVLTAAKIFASARGGSLDLTLTPRQYPGHYDGDVQVKDIRVINASVLTELLNAISVVGLLEQMNGSGLVFNEADGSFVLTPEVIQITRGSAVGASLGVSMAGNYETASGRLAMQGVVSPIYLLNGIGAIFTRKGEGLFGFNYTLKGTSSEPDVSVNPLSIFTPGMFRDIFRTPLPVAQGNG